MMEQDTLRLNDPTWGVACKQCAEVFSVPDAIDARIPKDDDHFNELPLRCPKCRYLFRYKRRDMHRLFDLPVFEQWREEKHAYEWRIAELEEEVKRLSEQLKNRNELIYKLAHIEPLHIR